MALLNKQIQGALLSVVLLTPSLVFAAPRTYADLINVFIGFIMLLIPIVGGMAVLIFFWGLAKFVFAAGDERGHESGRNLMIYGLVAFFVMLSIYGLVSFVGSAVFGDSFFNHSAPTFFPSGGDVGSGYGSI